MGRVHEALDDNLIDWIGQQHLFFVASAPLDGGHVNLSPKGHDTFRVIDKSTVAYLDLTGSGVETIAHFRENGRLTIMFCAFEGPPRILRLYGRGEAIEPDAPDFERSGRDVSRAARCAIDHSAQHRSHLVLVRVLGAVHGLRG